MAKIVENKGMAEVVVTKEVTTSYTLLNLSVEEYTALAVLVGGLSGGGQLRAIVNKLWRDVFEEYYNENVLKTTDKKENILYNKLRKGLSSHVS